MTGSALDPTNDTGAIESMDGLTERLVEEWPAVLAVTVLIASHAYLSGVQGEPLRPIGLPLLAAMAVFLVAEIGRRLVGSSDA